MSVTKLRWRLVTAVSRQVFNVNSGEMRAGTDVAIEIRREGKLRVSQLRDIVGGPSCGVFRSAIDALIKNPKGAQFQEARSRKLSPDE